MVRIGCLIINWNGANDTLELLQSLEDLAGATGFCLDIAVVDNNSDHDDFRHLLDGVESKVRGVNVRLVRNSINVGVPAAYNQAIQLLGLNYDYFLRLDNDVVVLADGVVSMIRAIENGRSSGVEISGGNVRFYDNREVNNCGAVSIDLLKGFTNVTYPEQGTAADGVLGCIMLISGGLVARLSPTVFDPLLFICTDESELSLHAKTLGISTWYVPEVVGFHKGGRSTGRISYLANYYAARNWAILRLRYTVGLWGCVRVLFSFVIGIAKTLIRKKVYYAFGTMAGVAFYVGEISDARAKRRSLKESLLK